MRAQPVRLLTADHVATRLRCSKRTVYRLIEQGELSAIRISEKLLRIHPDAVDAYLERKIAEFEFENGFSRHQ